MTAGSNQYVDYVIEQLMPLGNVASNRFFGGVGLAADGVQFAMIMGSVLYFVVDDTTRPKYKAMGSTCFSYGNKKGRVDVGKYYSVATEFIEDDERLVALAKESIRAANFAKKPSAKRAKTRLKTGALRKPK